MEHDTAWVTPGWPGQFDGLLTSTDPPTFDTTPLPQAAAGIDDTVMMLAPDGHGKVPENW